jgi:hypothetical protein
VEISIHGRISVREYEALVLGFRHGIPVQAQVNGLAAYGISVLMAGTVSRIVREQE